MNNYFEYENVSLTVVKKLNKKKVFGLLLIILLILILIMVYVFNVHQKMLKISTENENTNIQDNIIEDNSSSEEGNPAEEIQTNTKIPVLTQIGRNNMENIYNVIDEKIAYLTFDDGPSTNVTPQILDILDQYDVKATFFVLGCNVVRYPDILKQEYDRGNYIANHGYSHVYDSIYQSAQEVLNEYTRTEEEIRTALGIPEFSSHLFRFPGGSMGTKYRAVKDEAKQLLSDNDILYIDWNSLTNDAVAKPVPTRESIMENLKNTVGTKTSVVILMHDANSKQLTADMLPAIIEYLKEQGYTFKTFYDVIK